MIQKPSSVWMHAVIDRLTPQRYGGFDHEGPYERNCPLPDSAGTGNLPAAVRDSHGLCGYVCVFHGGRSACFQCL